MLTIAIVVLFFVAHGIITAVRQEAGYSTPGMVAVVLLVVTILVIRWIWKK